MKKYLSFSNQILFFGLILSTAIFIIGISFPSFASGWAWLDLNADGYTECYCFDNEGHLYKSTVTPDGYTVDENGAWIDENGTVITKRVSGVLTGETVEKQSSYQESTIVNSDEYASLKSGIPITEDEYNKFLNYIVQNGWKKRVTKVLSMGYMIDLVDYTKNGKAINPKIWEYFDEGGGTAVSFGYGEADEEIHKINSIDFISNTSFLSSLDCLYQAYYLADQMSKAQSIQIPRESADLLYSHIIKNGWTLTRTDNMFTSYVYNFVKSGISCSMAYSDTDQEIWLYFGNNSTDINVSVADPHLLTDTFDVLSDIMGVYNK